MDSDLKRLIFWNLIMASVLPLRADEPKCFYLDLTERIGKGFETLEVQNEDIIARLANWEDQQTREKEKHRPRLPPYNYILTVQNLEYDGWEMVFRATAGNGHSVFDAWTKGKGSCDNKPVTMDRSLSCHYRSHKVAHWNNLRISKVKFALYSPDKEVARVIFDGADTDLTSWFDKARILESSWPDLTPGHDFNIFSIAGDFRAGALDRRFQINRQYGGCDKDVGHMVTVDTLTVPKKACKWDVHIAYPQFLYSTINSADRWIDRFFGRAEYLAIFVKTA